MSGFTKSVLLQMLKRVADYDWVVSAHHSNSWSAGWIRNKAYTVTLNTSSANPALTHLQYTMIWILEEGSNDEQESAELWKQQTYLSTHLVRCHGAFLGTNAASTNKSSNKVKTCMLKTLSNHSLMRSKGIIPFIVGFFLRYLIHQSCGKRLQTESRDTRAIKCYETLNILLILWSFIKHLCLVATFEILTCFHLAWDMGVYDTLWLLLFLRFRIKWLKNI